MVIRRCSRLTVVPLRNYDEYGKRLARPRTLLIDSEQLESGDALDKNFREMASDEIDRFRRSCASVAIWRQLKRLPIKTCCAK